MPKPKSSRGAVRKTPQPKPYTYIAAVFVDDYGRDRALTVAAANSFAKKKLAARAEAKQRKVDRDWEMALQRGNWETARAIRKLRKAERKSDIEMSRLFRRLVRTKVRLPKPVKHGKPKRAPSIIYSKRFALPKYDGPIRDKFSRRSVFARFRYYSSRTARPGVSRRVTEYIFRGAEIGSDGKVMMCTNVGETIEETVAGLDHLEQVNWSAQKGAKVLNHAVLAMDYRWTPEQMLEVGEEWAEQCFGQYDLPYVVCLHAPPEEGDERNWHLHVVWSWRPLERVGDHEWMVEENLRTDLDGADGMRTLRENFAHVMTGMAFQSGHADLYTALSNAARSLPVEGQIHLDEGRARQARAGKFVPANEENFERVLRSKVAMADDELRRADERVSEELSIMRRVRARFAQGMSVPPVPARPFSISAIPKTLERFAGKLRPPPPLVEPRPVPAVPNPRYLSALSPDLVGRLAALQARLGKIANLRNVDAAPAHPPPPPGYTASRFERLQLPRLRIIPKLAREGSAPSAPSVVHSSVAGVANVRPVAATAPIPVIAGEQPPKPPARGFKTAPIIANLRLPAALPKKAEIASPPVPPPAASYQVAASFAIRSPAHVPALVSTATLDAFAASRLRVDAILKMLDQKDAKEVAARAAAQRSAEARKAGEAHRALLSLLDEVQFLLARDRDGDITVPVDALTKAGVKKFEPEAQVMAQLSQVYERQQKELEAIAQQLSIGKSVAHLDEVWRFGEDASQDAKFALFKWRDNAAVSATLYEFDRTEDQVRQSLPPDAIRSWFLARVNGDTKRLLADEGPGPFRRGSVSFPDRGLGD